MRATLTIVEPAVSRANTRTSQTADSDLRINLAPLESSRPIIAREVPLMPPIALKAGAQTRREQEPEERERLDVTDMSPTS